MKAQMNEIIGKHREAIRQLENMRLKLSDSKAKINLVEYAAKQISGIVALHEQAIVNVEKISDNALVEISLCQRLDKIAEELGYPEIGIDRDKLNDIWNSFFE